MMSEAVSVSGGPGGQQIMESTLMSINLSISSPVELECPNCRVRVRLGGGVAREICPYCGSWYDPDCPAAQLEGGQARLGSARPSTSRRERERSRRSSQVLPDISLSSSLSSTIRSRGEQGVGSLMASSLGRITLTSLGFGKDLSQSVDYRLPPVSSDTQGKLVQVGSGNTSPDSGALAVRNSRRGSEIKDISLSVSSVSGQPTYPKFKKCREKFLRECSEAKKSGEYTKMVHFYGTAFQNFVNLNAVFKIDPDQDGANLDSPDLDIQLLNIVMDNIRAMSAGVQKTMLKSIITSLLDHSKPLYKKDNVRALLILLLNPIFSAQSTYTVFAHVLQTVTNLSNGDHQLLVHWFRSLETDRLSGIVRNLLQLITIRQFPPADKSLPPLNKSKWWIPTATKVLALMNAANNSCSPTIIEYTEFYNIALDHMDLMKEYYTWQNPDKPGQFSYCQYPFILSIVAKRHILTKDSEQQMILTARRSLVQKMARHQTPQIEIFFLNISVRRDNLVTDSLKEISSKQKDLKKKLKVSFVGEPGLDMGGLTKEWFQLLIKQIFDAEYGMFVYHTHSRCYWFSMLQEGNLREYNLIGVLMGLAVYNSIILDLHFPSICYRKLLTPPVVPQDESVPVGVAKNLTVDDLAEMMPDVANSLQNVLEYEGDVEADMYMTFQISVGEYGKIKTVDLKPGGDEIPVTEENRGEFVSLYLDYILNTAVHDRFRAFYLGFHSVCASNALIMLRPEEVEILVCGAPTMDLAELKKVVVYDGYRPGDETVLHFWEVLLHYSEMLQKKFLLFTTGSDRVPVGGMQEMTFKISKLKDKTNFLPEAHTCFNQLVLPDYKNKEVLKEKLTIAISNAEGFGLE